MCHDIVYTRLKQNISQRGKNCNTCDWSTLFHSNNYLRQTKTTRRGNERRRIADIDHQRTISIISNILRGTSISWSHFVRFQEQTRIPPLQHRHVSTNGVDRSRPASREESTNSTRLRSEFPNPGWRNKERRKKGEREREKNGRKNRRRSRREARGERLQRKVELSIRRMGQLCLLQIPYLRNKWER